MIDFFGDQKQELSIEGFHINSTKIQPYDDNLVLLPITKGLSSWGEAEALANKMAHGLPTSEDIKESGFTAGEQRLYMPVSRPDFKEDWC